MRSPHLVVLPFVLALAAAACAPNSATSGDGPRYAAVSPTIGDTPSMVRRQGPVPSLAELRGSSPQKLENLLGEPSLRRRDGAAEMWHYASPECVLILFIYPAEGGAHRVAHLEASPGGTSDGALAQCIRAAATRPISATL